MNSYAKPFPFISWRSGKIPSNRDTIKRCEIGAWLYWCMAALMHGCIWCLTALVPGCFDAWLHWCIAALVHGSIGVKLHWCMAALVHGCIPIAALCMHDWRLFHLHFQSLSQSERKRNRKGGGVYDKRKHICFVSAEIHCAIAVQHWAKVLNVFWFCRFGRYGFVINRRTSLGCTPQTRGGTLPKCLLKVLMFSLSFDILKYQVCTEAYFTGDSNGAKVVSVSKIKELRYLQ